MGKKNTSSAVTDSVLTTSHWVHVLAIWLDTEQAPSVAPLDTSLTPVQTSINKWLDGFEIWLEHFYSPIILANVMPDFRKFLTTYQGRWDNMEAFCKTWLIKSFGLNPDSYFYEFIDYVNCADELRLRYTIVEQDSGTVYVFKRIS